jgi:hypothetical protein
MPEKQVTDMNHLSFFFVISASLSQTQATPDIKVIERQVLDYRRAIRSAHLELSQKIYKKIWSKPAREFHTTIWLRDKKLRIDVVLRYKESDPYHREIVCVNCKKEGYYIQHSEQDPAEFGQKGTKVSLAMRKIPSDPKLRASLDVIHPHMLGMIAATSRDTSMTDEYHLESFVGRADRKTPSIKQIQWRDQQCWLETYETLNGSKIRIWIVPGQGPSVGRIEAELEHMGKKYQSTVENTLKRDPSSGLWYPEKCVYEFTIADQLEEGEIAEIKVHSLNQPVPAETFMLSGLNLAKDTPVSLDTPGLRSWDGQKLVRYKREPPEEDIDPIPSNSWRPYLLAGCVGFAVLAASALCWYFFGKKTVTR